MPDLVLDAPEWSPAERRAWLPPEKLLPSQWAERNRRLSRRQSSRHGRWKNANAPFLVALMDLPFVFRQIRKMNLKKAGQVGGSEVVRIVIGWAASEEPDPALLNLPDENSGRAIFGERILPLFDDTECLAELQTDSGRDMKLSQVTLSNGFTLRLAWSGSAASMASHPIRFAFNDEVDKMKKWVGIEASPLKLVEIRTATYADSVIYNVSTPTTRLGVIHNLEEASPIRLRFFVPCPHCGTPQQLAFDRVRWEPFKDLPDAAARATAIVAAGAAWHECQNQRCGGKMLDAHKPKAVAAGFWGTFEGDDGHGDCQHDGRFRYYCDGRYEGELPPGDEVGVQIGALPSLAAKHRFPLIAAEFLRSKEKPSELMNFYNSWLGEVFEQQVTSKPANLFSARCKGAAEHGFAPRVVPAWASRLILSADTQQDDFYFVIRAWGHNFRSRRVWHGKCLTLKDLEQIAFGSYYPYEGNVYPALCCYAAGIDTGGGTRRKQGPDGDEEDLVPANRTDEVYRWCMRDPTRRVAIKGESEPMGMPIRLRKVTYTPPKGAKTPYDVWLHLIDTQHFNDILDAKIGERVMEYDAETGEVTGEADAWELNAEDDPDYNRHLSAVHKVVANPKTKAQRWVRKTPGARKDFRDCEIYNLAVAHGPGKCGMLPTPRQFAEQRKMQKEMARPGGVRMPDGRPFLATQRK